MNVSPPWEWTNYYSTIVIKQCFFVDYSLSKKEAYEAFLLRDGLNTDLGEENLGSDAAATVSFFLVVSEFWKSYDV